MCSAAHVFCYDTADELIVEDYIRRLKSEVNTAYRIIECDLYEIFLSLLEDKRVLKSIDGLEEKRGKEYLLNQLQKIATPEALLARMDYSPHGAMVLAGVMDSMILSTTLGMIHGAEAGRPSRHCGGLGGRRTLLQVPAHCVR